jgi:hypothetical protein
LDKEPSLLLPEDVYGDIPPEFRTVKAPENPKVEVLYRLARIELINNSPTYTWAEKARLLRTQQKLLIAAKNAHECACCGIILRIPALVGSECSKHPQRFPATSSEVNTGNRWR